MRIAIAFAIAIGIDSMSFDFGLSFALPSSTFSYVFLDPVLAFVVPLISFKAYGMALILCDAIIDRSICYRII